MKMNRSLSILAEGKTQWDTTTCEFKEPTEDIRLRVRRYAPNYIRFLKQLNETKPGFKNVLEVLTNLIGGSEVEDKLYQTLVNENLLMAGFPKLIPIKEAIAKIKIYKELTKVKIEERDKKEYEKLENLSLDPFDV